MSTTIKAQTNATTKNAYNGKNQAELIQAKLNNSFKSDEWVTFLQAKSIGRMIKGGSKSIGIFKGFQDVDEKDKDGKIVTTSRPVGFARVFNLDQTKKV